MLVHQPPEHLTNIENARWVEAGVSKLIDVVQPGWIAFQSEQLLYPVNHLTTCSKPTETDQERGYEGGGSGDPAPNLLCSTPERKRASLSSFSSSSSNGSRVALPSTIPCCSAYPISSSWSHSATFQAGHLLFESPSSNMSLTTAPSVYSNSTQSSSPSVSFHATTFHSTAFRALFIAIHSGIRLNIPLPPPQQLRSYIYHTHSRTTPTRDIYWSIGRHQPVCILSARKRHKPPLI